MAWLVAEMLNVKLRSPFSKLRGRVRLSSPLCELILNRLVTRKSVELITYAMSLAGEPVSRLDVRRVAIEGAAGQ